MALAGLRVALLAASLALDVFAVCVGVGIRRQPSVGRLRVGMAFAAAEVAMNLIGAGLGAVAGRFLGDVAGYLGFLALIFIGAYMILETLREVERHFDLSRGYGLLLASISISLDSLGVGFSIVYIGVPIAITLATIACFSLAATALGLTLGRSLGSRVEERAGILGGVALVLTGILFAALKYYGIG
jgi:putative Mn2+ efflux pump MntP